MQSHPDFHKFHQKLPRGRREFLAFMLIISFISVNIIAPLNTMFEIGFTLENYLHILVVLPLIWVAVIATVLLTQKPARALVEKIIQPTDSFNAHIVVETLCSVLFIAAIMSIVGRWIGEKHISLEAIVHFFDTFPRAFTIAFFTETILAQPIARLIMTKYHVAKDCKKQVESC
jgi:hypothetical protein